MTTCTDSLRDPEIHSWLVHSRRQPSFLNPAEIDASRSEEKLDGLRVLVAQWLSECEPVESKTTKVIKCDAVGCDEGSY